MDSTGWHARRRAERASRIYDPPQRGPDGRFQPVEQALPLPQGFVGGFQLNGTPHGGEPDYSASFAPPPVPPKPVLPPRLHDGNIIAEAPMIISPSTSGASTLSRMSPVERSRYLRVVRMQPLLQFMVGPLLRYDTVDERGLWHGACLIVTADAGSDYEPYPFITYEWDPGRPSRESNDHAEMTDRRPSFSLAPHPADPYSPYSALTDGNGAMENEPPTSQFQSVRDPGQEIWVYEGSGGTFTFWRFPITIPLNAREMRINYRINDGQELHFFVPGQNQNMRLAAYSCNGFSAGINETEFRGPGFQTGYDPVWVDLLHKHAQIPFHVLVGGGDQLYCDGVTREPEMYEWLTLPKPEQKIQHPLTPEIASAIDRFYFNHYCQVFRSGAFARANSSIPMLNMADDHDLIDGFGSYPEDLQRSPIFSRIGSRGYFFFLLFQCFINVEVDGVDDRPGRHSNQSIIIGGPGAYIPYPSHSFLSYLGPQCYILMLDCRAERRKDQVCSQETYNKVLRMVSSLSPSVEHLIIQLGIPIAYPRMVLLEQMLDSKLNPLVALGKKGSMGLSGFVNKFNAEAELLDDLNDHWTAKNHKKERNMFIQIMQDFAQRTRTRVTFLSGDVHCASVGLLKTYVPEKNGRPIDPQIDHRYMLNVVSSAIVNTPPPATVLSLVANLATKVHKTLHHARTDETMLPLFEKDTDGSGPKSKFIMGRRNWCSIFWDNGDLVFDIRVEKEKGVGVTVGYPVRAPPPRWPV